MEHAMKMSQRKHPRRKVRVEVEGHEHDFKPTSPPGSVVDMVREYAFHNDDAAMGIVQRLWKLPDDEERKELQRQLTAQGGITIELARAWTRPLCDGASLCSQLALQLLPFFVVRQLPQPLYDSHRCIVVMEGVLPHHIDHRSGGDVGLKSCSWPSTSTRTLPARVLPLRHFHCVLHVRRR